MIELSTILPPDSGQDKGERGGIVERAERRLAREQQEIHIGENIGDFKITEPVLHRPKELPGTAQAQILLGETESVARLLDNL